MAMANCSGTAQIWNSPVRDLPNRLVRGPENVKVTKGADQIGAYHKTETHHRQFRRTCGGHLMSSLPAFGLIDVFAATIPDFPFRPQLHVNYAEANRRVGDVWR